MKKRYITAANPDNLFRGGTLYYNILHIKVENVYKQNKDENVFGKSSF